MQAVRAQLERANVGGGSLASVAAKVAATLDLYSACTKGDAVKARAAINAGADIKYKHIKVSTERAGLLERMMISRMIKMA